MVGRRAISTPHRSVMANVNDLRAELRKSQRAVNRKMRRNEKAHNIDQWGAYDVRVDRAKIDRYNSTQLRAAIERQRDFLSRKKQFVGSYNGDAMSRDTYRNYVKAAEKHNEELARRRKSWNRETLGKIGPRDINDEQMTGGGEWRKPGITNFNTHGFERVADPKAFHSERAMKQKTDKLAKMFTAREVAKSRREGKKTLNKMAKDTGNLRVMELINRMKGAQIDYLMDSIAFMHSMKLMYTTGQALKEPNPSSFSQELNDESLEEAIDMLEDVEKHINPRGGRL